MSRITVSTYLGDGAFVSHGSYHGEVVLTTSDGIKDTNTVVLDPNGVNMLIHWLKYEGLMK